MNTIFTPDEVRTYYESAMERERALSSKYFLAAITWKGDFQEYNRLMDLNASAQARAMALWLEMDDAIAKAEILAEKAREFESIRQSVYSEGCVELAPKTTFRRVVVRKLHPKEVTI